MSVCQCLLPGKKLSQSEEEKCCRYGGFSVAGEVGFDVRQG